MCQKWGSRRGIHGRRLGFSNGKMDDKVIHDVINKPFRPEGSCPENVISLSLFFLQRYKPDANRDKIMTETQTETQRETARFQYRCKMKMLLIHMS